MTNSKFNNTVLAVLAFFAGKKFSETHNTNGNEFLGAFNIADKIGFERNSTEWNAAVSGAMSHIKTIA